MGNQSSKVPEKTQEELMKERWLKLAGNKPTVEILNKLTEPRAEPINTADNNNKNDHNVIISDKVIHKTPPPYTNINEDKNPSHHSTIEASTPTEPKEINKIEPIPHPSKVLDKEHSTIEKIFRISLVESDKFTTLHLYSAQLQSQNVEPSFRINDLDDIILSIINEPSLRDRILEYFFETYHRAIEIIEKRYKHELDDRYHQIRNIIATYLGLIVYSPENFDLHINKNDVFRIFSNYYNETSEEEMYYLIGDIINNYESDTSCMSVVLSYLFNIIHISNTTSKNTFYNCDKIKKNLSFLNFLFKSHPITRSLFKNEPNFLPKGVNGRLIQTGSFLGPYLSLCSFELDRNMLKSFYSAMSQNESDNQVRIYTNKLNSLMDEVQTLIVQLIVEEDDFNFIYDVINQNIERTKMYINQVSCSSTGFLMNLTHVLLKILFETNQEYMINDIDINYCLSKDHIHFNKFDRIDNELAKQGKHDQHTNNVSTSTKLFFMVHCLINYFAKNINDDYTRTVQQLSQYFSTNNFNDPLAKELLASLRAMDVYIRNPELIKNILRLNEHTVYLLLNYENNLIQRLHDSSDVGEVNLFDECEKLKSNTNYFIHLSSLSDFLVKNVMVTSIMIRRFAGDLAISFYKQIKVIISFSLIFSSQINFITNPHLRAEIFEILSVFFVVQKQERASTQLSSFFDRMFLEEDVKNNLIPSFMRVFIDAERLGTSNQFYEKFNIRHKVLQLFQEIVKKSTIEKIYTEKVVEYANVFKFDTTKMINLLMNDVTYLIDECIDRLMQIKIYQERQSTGFEGLNEEEKQMEHERFKENDRIVRAELPLLNSSMSFLVIICNCCQDNFMNYRLAERLAFLLNYSLDVFTSHKASKLNIKNKSDYGFNPAAILTSLVKIYVAFKNYKEFVRFIVTDERSYKKENFEKVFVVKDTTGKVQVDFETMGLFEELVNKDLTEAEKELADSAVSYDDCPDELIDPITSVMMEDPVELPASKAIVDRSTIETHLLSDTTDPFNRTHLTKEMLIACDDLKNKIIAYKAQKIKDKADKN